MAFPLSHWRLASGIETDFIIGGMQVAIEAKAAECVISDHLKGLRELVRAHPEVRLRLVICREPPARKTEDGIAILPAARFIRRLWDGDLL